LIKINLLKESINKHKFSILVFLSILFNVLVLSNLLKSDYFGDDLYNFQALGLIPSVYPSITDFTLRSILGWMDLGRFFPGAWYAYYLFALCDTLYTYKLFVVLVTVTNISLFAYLIYLWAKDRYMALLILIVTPLFFQYRYYHDPMLSFHGLMQVLFIYTTLSLVFLTKYLQGSPKYHYYLSLFFFTLSLLTYEISYVFILLYIPIVLSYLNLKSDFKRFFVLGTPYLLILVGLTLYTLYLRSNLPPGWNPYRPSWDVYAILITYFNQTVSVIPTTYYWMFENHSEFFKHIEYRYVVFASLFVFIYTFALSLKKTLVINKNLFIMGMLLLFLPGLLISISPKFHDGINKVDFGLAYLPIYIQSFGGSLLLALLIRKLSTVKYHIVTVLLLGIVLIVHLVSNNQVIEKVNKPYKSSREVLSLFFSGTFGQKLQDGATIQFAYDSPLHRSEFLNMIIRKNLHVVIAPNDNYDYQIWCDEINSDFMAIRIKHHTVGIEHVVVYKKNGEWEEVYNDENTHSNITPLPPMFNAFYEWEGEAGTFRWAGDNANILWINNEDKPKEEKISFEMGSLIPRGITVKLNGKIIDNFSITPGVPSPHSYTLILTPGRNSIEFITPESSVTPGGLDTRNLSFSIANFHTGQNHND